MKWQVIKNRIFLWSRKIIFTSLYIFTVLAVASYFVLLIPAVQHALISRYLKTFTEVSGFEITTGSFYLVWWDRLTIENLKVVDPEKNTLLETTELKVNFAFFNLLTDGNVNIDGVSLQKPTLYLKRITDQDTQQDFNISILVNRINAMAGSGSGGNSSAKVNIGEIQWHSGRFMFNDVARDSLTAGFDYAHFDLDIPTLQAQNFRVIGDTIQFNIAELEARDKKTDLHIKQMSSFFRISQNSLDFFKLKLATDRSFIADSISFQYKSMVDLNDFNRKVKLDVRLKDTRIHPADLALFLPTVKDLPHILQLSGNITGRVNKLIYNNMTLNVGSSQFVGRLSLDGLPTFGETFIDIRLTKGEVNANDLKFMLKPLVFQRMQRVGAFNFTGSFTGFPNDFVAAGKFESKLGRVSSDINLKIDETNPDRSVYEGSLEMMNFDLGTFLGDTATFQRVSMKGRIGGRGFSAQTADFRLNGVVSAFGLRGYNYKNINTNARFASSLFKGKLTIDDPNLQFDLTGEVDIRQGVEKVNIKARVDTAQLKPLGLSKKDFFVAAKAEINAEGLQLDSVSGDARISDLLFQFDGDSLFVDTVRITSSLRPTRKLALTSSLVDVALDGDYTYSTLFKDAQSLFYEFLINIKNDQQAIRTYYAEKRPNNSVYTANLKISMHDINPLLQLVDFNGYVSTDAILEGRFSNGLTLIFNAYTIIDTLRIASHVLLENEIEINGSKIRDSTTSLAAASFISRKQLLNGNVQTKDLLAEAIWNKDHVDVNLDLEQEKVDNKINLEAEVDFLKDTTVIKMLPSRIHLLDKDWVVQRDNRVILTGREWSFQNLAFTHDVEALKFQGFVSDNPEKNLIIQVDNFDLSILNTVTSEKFGGVVDGEVLLRNLYDETEIENNVTIAALTINSFLVGTVTGINKWNPEARNFTIRFFLDRLGTRTADISGTLDPRQNEDPLQLSARFDKVNIKIIEPLLKEIFSGWDGTLTGRYNVTGTFGKPKVAGSGYIENGKLTVNYLNTTYAFKGNLEMIPTQIIFKNFQLTDVFNNQGVLEGYIVHRNFQTFRLNIDASFSNMQMLNTTAKDNDLFYGEGYASGAVNIFGPATNLKISATAKTERNTRIYIPISGSSSVEKKDFIQFIHFTDTIIAKSLAKAALKQKDRSGIALDFNFDITPDAYAEIIFDIKAGDIIRGRGNGDLKIQLDTKGEFNMFGAVEFTEGAYNFTLYDIINKEFNIRPGSRISWYGNPYQGQMDINASYRQLASFGPTINDQSDDILSAPGVRRKYPAEVVLKLEGAMLSPQISFDIEARDLPTNIVTPSEVINLYLEFNAFKARLDEQELKRQVFSLIVLRRFSPPNSFNTSGTLANSVSEFLSNQLSYWLTQVDQNLEIDLDLGALDAEAFNTFQLRMSYSFLGGRLRITRDGTFSSQYNQSNAGALVGDWTVDYLLTPDGKFKVKMYSRSNFNQVANSLGNQNLITTGVSLTHTQNFNEFRDLLRSARDRRIKDLQRKEEESEEQPEEDPDEN